MIRFSTSSFKWWVALSLVAIAMIQPTEAQRRSAPVDRAVKFDMDRSVSKTRVIVRVDHRERRGMRLLWARNSSYKIKRDHGGISHAGLFAQDLGPVIRDRGYRRVAIDNWYLFPAREFIALKEIAPDFADLHLSDLGQKAIAPLHH